MKAAMIVVNFCEKKLGAGSRLSVEHLPKSTWGINLTAEEERNMGSYDVRGENMKSWKWLKSDSSNTTIRACSHKAVHYVGGMRPWAFPRQEQIWFRKYSLACRSAMQRTCGCQWCGLRDVSRPSIGILQWNQHQRIAEVLWTPNCKQTRTRYTIQWSSCQYVLPTGKMAESYRWEIWAPKAFSRPSSNSSITPVACVLRGACCNVACACGDQYTEPVTYI